jgi:hypothetical protein
LLSAVVFASLVVLGKQFFSGLIGSSGNSGLPFTSLSDFDFEVRVRQ